MKKEFLIREERGLNNVASDSKALELVIAQIMEISGTQRGRVNDKNHAQEDGNQGLKITRRHRMESTLDKRLSKQ